MSAYAGPPDCYVLLTQRDVEDFTTSMDELGVRYEVDAFTVFLPRDQSPELLASIRRVTEAAGSVVLSKGDPNLPYNRKDGSDGR